MTIDMTFERREKFIRDDSYAEGLERGVEQGIEQGQMTTLKKLIEQGLLSYDDAARISGKNKDELMKQIDVI